MYIQYELQRKEERENARLQGMANDLIRAAKEGRMVEAVRLSDELLENDRDLDSHDLVSPSCVMLCHAILLISCLMDACSLGGQRYCGRLVRVMMISWRC